MMKIVNRGYILVKTKNEFFDWLKNQEIGLDSELDINEGNIYLIEDDFFDEELIIENHFKKIFKNEMVSILDEIEILPEINIEQFNEFFQIELGTCVFDCLKNNIVSD